MSEQNNIPFKSARKRKLAAIIVMWIMIAFSAISFFLSGLELILYAKYDSLDPSYLFSGFETFVIIISSLADIFWGIMQFVFIIVFLMWVHRVYRNLKATNVEGLKHSPGWAVGWYFIPIANLFKPFVVMKETWLATNHAKAGLDDWKTGASTPMIPVWWILFIVGNLIFNNNLFADYETIGDYKIDAIISLIGEPIYIVSGICIILLMSKITKTQDTELQERMVLHDEAVATLEEQEVQAVQEEQEIQEEQEVKKELEDKE